ncbi:MAG: helix-turn-helix transcriptional regulator [Clostridia bacterium]|nr:helix-turn-helix transcriptional regulator [Clostridia bacterium]
MKTKNICKFGEGGSSGRLEIHNFVLESNKDITTSVTRTPYSRLFLISTGSGEVNIDGTDHSVKMGSILFVFENEAVKMSDGIDECMYISFGGVRASELLVRFSVNRINRCFDELEGVIPLWRESLSRANENNLDIIAESIFLYTISRTSGERQEKCDVISAILSISEEHFTESSFSLGDISEMLGYNSKYISHLFKNKMGISFTTYLRDLRIKYAVSLFDYGLDSVKNVAFLSGFSDPLYFSAVFKSAIGISPKEYKIRRTETASNKEKSIEKSEA